MDEDSSTEQKTWQVYSLGKINVFRLHFSEYWGQEAQVPILFHTAPELCYDCC